MVYIKLTDVKVIECFAVRLVFSPEGLKNLKTVIMIKRNHR